MKNLRCPSCGCPVEFKNLDEGYLSYACKGRGLIVVGAGNGTARTYSILTPGSGGQIAGMKRIRRFIGTVFILVGIAYWIIVWSALFVVTFPFYYLGGHR